MEVSVLIPWRDRPELAEALTRNKHHLNRDGVEVLVVNGGGDQDELQRIIGEQDWAGIRVVRIPAEGRFNKSEYLNVGVSFSRGERVFVLDADVVLTSSFLEEAIEATVRERCFATVAVVVESAPEISGRWTGASPIRRRSNTIELVTQSGRTVMIRHWAEPAGRRAGPGLIVVGREEFVAVQGFNSGLEGWGFEDYDLQLRLQLAIELERRTFGEALHLSHPHAADGSTDVANRDACYSNYVEGRFLGTYDADVERWRGRAFEAAC